MPKKQKKRRKKASDNVFDLFTQFQVAQFKEGFQLMDRDKDGKLGPDDLDWTHKHVNLPTTDEKIGIMLADSPTAINFTMLLSMFAEKASGEQDDDDVIIKGFKTFANAEGKIDAPALRVALTCFADKFTKEEADDALEMFQVKDGFLDHALIVKLLTGPAGDDDEEAKEEEE
ncbi:unnamed protein product [Meganyctiphanes norvegica]|uniref:EF-hand domain-containing protein n=1 Tax=Meganyctiphanes norvegica TaxID=48144 RepID=A0AAV2PHD6_MEGNR